jgi:hypothetical protein
LGNLRRLNFDRKFSSATTAVAASVVMVGARTGDDKTSLLFSVRHEAGALHRVLQPFAQHRVNLLTIESRPLKGRPWEYVFFLDLRGHRSLNHLYRPLPVRRSPRPRFSVQRRFHLLRLPRHLPDRQVFPRPSGYLHPRRDPRKKPPALP